MTDETVDYYEILQISPNAEPDTIHRVYRLLAQRFHPDNTATGNEAQFRALSEAYQVLSNPEQRASYDVSYESRRRDFALATARTGGGAIVPSRSQRVVEPLQRWGKW